LANKRCPICGYGRRKKVESERKSSECAKCGAIYRFGDGVVSIADLEKAYPSNPDFADNVVVQRNVHLGNSPTVDEARSGEKVLVVGEAGDAVTDRLASLGWLAEVVSVDGVGGAVDENDVVVAPHAFQFEDIHGFIKGALEKLRGGGFLVFAMLSPHETLVGDSVVANILVSSESLMKYLGIEDLGITVEISEVEYTVWLRK